MDLLAKGNILLERSRSNKSSVPHWSTKINKLENIQGQLFLPLHSVCYDILATKSHTMQCLFCHLCPSLKLIKHHPALSFHQVEAGQTLLLVRQPTCLPCHHWDHSLTFSGIGSVTRTMNYFSTTSSSSRFSEQCAPLHTITAFVALDTYYVTLAGSNYVPPANIMTSARTRSTNAGTRHTL